MYQVLRLYVSFDSAGLVCTVRMAVSATVINEED